MKSRSQGLRAFRIWFLALMLPVEQPHAAACDVQTMDGRWGFISHLSAAKRNGLAGNYTLLMRARLRADGTLSGVYFLHRRGYPNRAWWQTSGVFTIGPQCGVYLFWRDSGGFRYSARGFVSADGKTLYGAGQADGYAFSLEGRRM